MVEFLNRFPIGQEVRNIFEQGLIHDRDIILQVLEEYKFLTRLEILQAISGTSDFPFTQLDTTQHTESYGETVLYYTSRSEANVYICGYGSVNTNQIELFLSAFTVHFYRITPYNFYTAKITDYEPQYDPIILFKRIILEAIRRHATDVHFDTKHFTTEPEYTVAFRIDSEMFGYTDFKINERLNREIIGKVIESKTSSTSIDLNSPDGVTAVAKDVFGTGIAELRISANKCLDGFHYVIRIQKKDTVSLTIDKLGFHEHVMDDLNYVTRKRSGITLITGAIRTGKNTTAFAIENEMLKQPIKLVSYEYPIEVLMPVSQVDYANDTDVLLNAIRMAKKQDVNVAFLNEIPNKETAFAVQDLVNSSIHVITTMHLDRLWFLPYRLKEYYGNSYKDVISQINAVFNQKMFSVPCPHCQRKIMAADIQNMRIRTIMQSYGIKFAYTNATCEHCNGLGHIIGKNQPYAEHIVFSTDLISELLRCEEPYQMESILKTAVHKQHTSLEDYMLEAIGEGRLAIDSLDSIV